MHSFATLHPPIRRLKLGLCATGVLLCTTHCATLTDTATTPCDTPPSLAQSLLHSSIPSLELRADHRRAHARQSQYANLARFYRHDATEARRTELRATLWWSYAPWDTSARRQCALTPLTSMTHARQGGRHG